MNYEYLGLSLSAEEKVFKKRNALLKNGHRESERERILGLLGLYIYTHVLKDRVGFAEMDIYGMNGCQEN